MNWLSLMDFIFLFFKGELFLYSFDRKIYIKIMNYNDIRVILTVRIERFEQFLSNNFNLFVLMMTLLWALRVHFKVQLKIDQT